MSIIMRPSKTLPEVFIYRDPIDFRKAHRGLAAIVETELGHKHSENRRAVLVLRIPLAGNAVLT